MAKNSQAPKALAAVMQASLTKNPQLADKQRRLLAKLSSDTNEPLPDDSTPSANSAEAAPSPKEQ